MTLLSKVIVTSANEASSIIQKWNQMAFIETLLSAQQWPPTGNWGGGRMNDRQEMFMWHRVNTCSSTPQQTHEQKHYNNDDI